jgi:CRP-like cAMP-binding protein
MTSICAQPTARPQALGTLRSAWLFCDCTDAELRQIRAEGTALTVPEGTTLLRAGTRSQSCLVIASGRAIVSCPDGHEIGHYTNGAVLGTASLVCSAPSRVTVTAATEMHLFIIDTQRLLQFTQTGNAWSLKHRIEVLTTEHDRVAFETVAAVAAYL